MWGFINVKGEYIHLPAYNAYYIAFDSDGQNVYYVKENGLIAILKTDGSKIQSFGRFSGSIVNIIEDKYIITSVNYKNSLYNKEGKQILTDSFQQITHLNRDYFLVVRKKQMNISNGNGELLLPKYCNNIQAFNNCFLINTNDSSYLIDTTGKKISITLNSKRSKYPGRYLPVDKSKYNQLSYFYNADKRFLMLPKSDGLMHPYFFNKVEYYGNNYIIYSDTLEHNLVYNTQLRNYQFFDSVDFTNLPCLNSLAVSKNNTTFFYDSVFNLTNHLPYLYVECDDAVLYTFDSLFLTGMATHSGSEIISPRYDYIGNSFNGMAIFQTHEDTTYGVLTLQGNIILKCDYDQIELDSQVIVCYKNKTKYYYELDKNLNIIGTAKFSNVNILKTRRISTNVSLSNGSVSSSDRPDNAWFYIYATRRYGLRNTDSSIAIKATLQGYRQIGQTSYYLIWAKGQSQPLNNINTQGYVYGVVDYTSRKIVIRLQYTYIDTQALRRNNGITNIRVVSGSRGHELLLKPGRVKRLPYNFVASLSNGYFIALKGGKIKFENDEKNAYGRPQDYLSQITLDDYPGIALLNNNFGKFANVVKGDFYFLDMLGNEMPMTRSTVLKREKNNCVVFIQKGFWGLYNLSGQMVLKNNYTDISDSYFRFYDSLFLVNITTNKMGLIDQNSKIIINAQYNLINEVDDEGYTTAKNDRGWCVINIKQEEIQLEKISKALSFTEGRAPVKIKTKWGYISHDGSVIIPAIYSKVSAFKNGIACVRFGTDFYYINASGEKITNKVYTEATDYFGNHALVAKKGIGTKYNLINPQGEKENIKFRSYEQKKKYHLMIAKKVRRMKILSDEKMHEAWYKKCIHNRNSSHILFKTSGHEYHIFDEDGNLTGKIKANDVKPFEEGYCIIEIKKKNAVINGNGEIVYGPTDKRITQVFDSFVVVKEEKFMYIERFSGARLNFTKAKNIRIQNINNIVQIWADGICYMGSEIGIFATKRGTSLIDLNNDITALRSISGIRLLDSTGFYTNQKTFNQIKPFKNGYAVFTISGRSGIYKNTQPSPWLLECIFDKIEIVSETLIRYEKDNEFGYMNIKTGVIIWKGEL